MARPNSAPAPSGAGGVLSRYFAAICMPAGVVSTMRPSLPLTVRMSPFGAMAMPSGLFSFPPEVTTAPVPALPGRKSACGIAVIVLFWVSATYSVPCRLRPTPVGPNTKAVDVGLLGEARAHPGDRHAAAGPRAGGAAA